MRILHASVTFSGISPAVEYNDAIYFSGKSVYENDILSVINHCESLGYKESQIVIDTILSGNKEPSTFDASDANALKLMKRSSALFKYYQHMHGIMRAKDGHRNVNFRYVVAPHYTIPSKILPLNFTPEEAKALMQQGERDTEHTIYHMLYNMEDEIQKRL